MLYGVGAMQEADDNQLEKLRKFDRKVKRSMTGLFRTEEGLHYSNKGIYEEAGISKDLKEVYRKSAENYYGKIEEHANKWFQERIGKLEAKYMLMKTRDFARVL